MLDIMAGTDQKYSYVSAWLVCWCLCTSRWVSCPVVRPMVRCTMSVMDQKGSLLAVACARLVLHNAWSSVIHDLRQSTDW